MPQFNSAHKTNIFTHYEERIIGNAGGVFLALHSANKINTTTKQTYCTYYAHITLYRQRIVRTLRKLNAIKNTVLQTTVFLPKFDFI
jgi:hypothetical protein